MALETSTFAILLALETNLLALKKNEANAFSAGDEITHVELERNAFSAKDRMRLMLKANVLETN